LDCGNEVAAWLSRYIGADDLRLVYHSGTKTQRTLSEMQQKFPMTSPHDLGTFQNYTSYLIMGEESIEELNKHIDKPVTYRNFRPSILIEKIPEPFAEIRWGYVRIGDKNVFKASKPCERLALKKRLQFFNTVNL